MIIEHAHQFIALDDESHVATETCERTAYVVSLLLG
jgi:hypothetical protein